jgi:hypothetical protein
MYKWFALFFPATCMHESFLLPWGSCFIPLTLCCILMQRMSQVLCLNISSLSGAPVLRDEVSTTTLRDVVSLCYSVFRGFWVLGRAIEIANKTINNW